MALITAANLNDTIGQAKCEATKGLHHERQQPYGKSKNNQQLGNKGKGLFLNLRYCLKQRNTDANEKASK